MTDVTAIIPAAGLGTRFLPFTRVVSKELLPILNKPTLHYILEELVAAGITNVVIVTREGKDDLRRYCDKDESSDEQWRQLLDRVSITWVNQSAPKGLGHAILSAEEAVCDAWLLVALPDVIVDSNPGCGRQMLQAYRQHGRPLVATHQVKSSLLSNSGVLDVESKCENNLLKIRHIVEKPAVGQAPSNWIVSGRYLLPKEIFSILRSIRPDESNEIQLTSALNVLGNICGIDGFVFNGHQMDTGNVAGWLAANFHFAQKDPAYAEILASLGPDAITGFNQSSPT